MIPAPAYTSLHNWRVLVMGLGTHGGGLGVARWLLRQGARVTVTDMASAEALAAPCAVLQEAEQECGSRIEYVLGTHRAEDFTSHDLIVVNPAVRPDSPWLHLAREARVPIETEMTLFFRRCPGPIIGITGTKGKTTTALLTAAMLRQQFPDTVVAGNLRVSALEALEHITPATPVVLELSSFQLVGLGQAHLSPRYACVTNFSPDHINYHGSLEEYARAKQQIFAHQPDNSVLVLHQSLRHWVEQAVGDQSIQRAVWTFDLDSAEADCYLSESGAVLFQNEFLVHRDDMHLLGRHNQANMMAAAMLVRTFGVVPKHIQAAARDFRGVAHRLELVRELEDVRYINDTTATNPAAALAALQACDAPIVLLAGGADKHLELNELAHAIATHVKAVVLLAGSATKRLEQALRTVLQQHTVQSTASSAESGAGQIPNGQEQATQPLILGVYDDFEAAIHAARGSAVPGDIVLLSPGCASFGMFRNEFHRGEEFCRIVRSM